MPENPEGREKDMPENSENAAQSSPDEVGEIKSPPDEVGEIKSPPDEVGEIKSPPEGAGERKPPPEEAGEGKSPPGETGEGKSPPGETGEGESPPGETGEKKRRFSWKKVVLVAIALVVVGALVQVARSGGFGDALNTTGGDSQRHKSAPHKVKHAQKPKTVRLGPHTIPRQSGPVVMVNPGLVTPGGKVTVEGAGFDAKSSVNLVLKTSAKQSDGVGIGSAKADRTGALNKQISVPDNVSRGATLIAQQRSGDNVAKAQLVSGGVVGSMRTSKEVGKPGDSVPLSARGFRPGERIGVFWGRVGGKPDATLTADSSGSVAQTNVKVGVAPTGASTMILVGEKSSTTATARFQILGLYPTLKSSPFALKSGKRMTVNAAGFAPNERVLFYINNASGSPAFTGTADGQGNVGAVTFPVPFGLKGQQSLTAIGDRTRAVVRAGFQVTPYTPTAEPSTYSGRAGTAVSFYVKGFAPNESVTLYVGGKGQDPKKVKTFRVDDQGAAKAAGSYKITQADEGGVAFKLVGQKSGSTAKASLNETQQGQQGQGQ